MRILVTGSRFWVHELTIMQALATAQGTTPARQMVLVHGACRTGADSIAARYAKANGWDIEAHPADWARYRDAAGPIRNQRMVDLGADLCLAFIRDQSVGSSGCLDKARRKGIKTTVWRHDGDRIWYDDQKVDVSRVHRDQGSLF